MEPLLPGTSDARRGWWFAAALAALAAVSCYGFWSRQLWRQEIWQAPGGERFLIFLAASLLWFGGWILWRPAWLAPATFYLVAAYSIAAVGALPVAAALFLLFACFALGRLLLAGLVGRAGPTGAPLPKSADGRRIACPTMGTPFLALLTGLGAFLWLGGLAAHFPVNYPATYLALLAAPLAASPRNTAACLREAGALLRPVRLDSRLEYAALALALLPVLAHWLVVLKPEVSTDALSMHLVVPAYVADHHQWSFDFRHFTWAVMPMGAVWGYTIAYLLGGEFAARFLNFALLAALCGFLYGSARRWASRPMAFLLTALFASTPVVQLVTGSLFVETFYAAMLAGALAALWRHRETGRPAWLAVCAFLLASSMAVKLMALPFVAVIGAVLAWELARMWRRGAKRWVLASAAVFLAVAPLPYAYAWRVTGNPVFPFANQLFRSPYYAPVMSPDSRFSEPLTWRTPFDVTFDTHRYWEGQDGSIGFHLLLLAPLVLLGFRRRDVVAPPATARHDPGRPPDPVPCRPSAGVPVSGVPTAETAGAGPEAIGHTPPLERNMPSGPGAPSAEIGTEPGSRGTGPPGAGRSWKFTEWTLVWVAFGGTFLGLALKPNVRYLYPAFPLLTLALALAPRPGPEGGASRRWLPGRMLAGAALVCLALNLWFLPSSSWYHKTFCLNPLERGAAERYLAAAAPVRLLVDRLNRRHSGENVLFLETGDIAELRAQAYTNGWHSYMFMQRVMALRTPHEALELARQLGIRHFIYPDPSSGVPVREALWKALIDRCSETEAGAPSGPGGFRLANLRPCTIAAAEVPAAGAYDDLDPRISFFGYWSHDTQFAQTANRSVTYSDVPGASFQFTFRGAAVTWVYTKALNRGVAQVFLDGQPRGEVDLYAADTAWRSRSVLRAAGEGDHVFEVRILNRPNPRSSGNYVDVDELIVE